MKMNKIIASSLILFWGLFLAFQSHKYAWLFQSIVSAHIGCAFAYLWSYYDLLDNLLIQDEKEKN